MKNGQKNGQSYANLEQAYMYHKAIENNDMKAARAIKFTVNPRKIKKLGSAVKMPDKDKWVNGEACEGQIF